MLFTPQQLTHFSIFTHKLVYILQSNYNITKPSNIKLKYREYVFHIFESNYNNQGL